MLSVSEKLEAAPPRQRSAQSSSSSRHDSLWHILHVTGQFCSMKPGLLWHSPIAAHVAQLVLLSSHAFARFGLGLPPLHMWHDARQLLCMNPWFRSHSPDRAHDSHDSSLSTQLGSTLPETIGRGGGGDGGLLRCCLAAACCFLGDSVVVVCRRFVFGGSGTFGGAPPP